MAYPHDITRDDVGGGRHGTALTRSASMETHHLRIHIGPITHGRMSPLPDWITIDVVKTFKAEDIIKMAVRKLKLGKWQKYELLETISTGGIICKERILEPMEYPLRIQHHWPRVVPSLTDVHRTEYHFELRRKEPDKPVGTWVEHSESNPVDSFLSSFLTQPKNKDYPDLCNLPDLNETTLLDNLKSRFENEKIYTYIGSILIAVNPFKFYPIYNPKYVKMYQNRKLGDLPPHIFAIADSAYYKMLQDKQNQCIVISGESGSGKTESTNMLLHHLSALSQRSVYGGGIEQTILGAGPVLEAFGNAKTVHNNNSSRFGKFIQVNYKENGMVHGAIVEKYLLEKSRIVKQAENERNYHVFYYLLAGASEAEKEEMGLLPAEEYAYLNQTKCFTLEDLDGEVIDECKDFVNLRKSMSIVGFSKSIQARVFCVLSAVLLIGNIEYRKTSDISHHECVQIPESSPVKTIASLLKVKEKTLIEALTKKKTMAGGETVVIGYNKNAAIATRDAMAKCLYGALFDWIVLQINHSLLSKRDYAEHKGKSIGVLDIFGFEDFARNSFEQFCINYANEHLQYYFNQHIFKFEQEEYVKEGIQWKNIEFIDNVNCLQLFTKKFTGLLSLLDEECNFPGATNETLLAKFHAQHANNPDYEAPQMRESAFSIIHYAGKVKYRIDDFREKNNDLMRHDIMLVLKNSAQVFVRELVGYDPVAVWRWAMVRSFFKAYFAFISEGRKYRSRPSSERFGKQRQHQQLSRAAPLGVNVNDTSCDPPKRVVVVSKSSSPEEDKENSSSHDPFTHSRSSDLRAHVMNAVSVKAKLRQTWGSEDRTIMERANRVMMKNKSFKPRMKNTKQLRDLKSMKSLASKTALGPRPSKGKANKPPSVSAQFNYSLTKLMENLNKANPFFVRCIKSNIDKAPLVFDEAIVLRQLRYTGMLATVKIRQSGYNYRLTFEDFIQQYRILLPKGLISSRVDIHSFLKSLDFDPDNYQIGKTKVFFREAEKMLLDNALHKAIMYRIVLIQRWMKMILDRNRFQRMREAAVVIQKYARRYIAQRQLYNRKLRLYACILIQKAWRGYRTRRYIEYQHIAATVIQRAVRAHLARRKYERLKEEKKLWEEEQQRKLEEERQQEEERKRKEEQERKEEEERLRRETEKENMRLESIAREKEKRLLEIRQRIVEEKRLQREAELEQQRSESEERMIAEKRRRMDRESSEKSSTSDYQDALEMLDSDSLSLYSVATESRPSPLRDNDKSIVIDKGSLVTDKGSIVTEQLDKESLVTEISDKVTKVTENLDNRALGAYITDNNITDNNLTTDLNDKDSLVTDSIVIVDSDTSVISHVDKDSSVSMVTDNSVITEGDNGDGGVCSRNVSSPFVLSDTDNDVNGSFVPCLDISMDLYDEEMRQKIEKWETRTGEVEHTTNLDDSIRTKIDENQKVSPLDISLQEEEEMRLKVEKWERKRLERLEKEKEGVKDKVLNDNNEKQMLDVINDNVASIFSESELIKSPDSQRTSVSSDNRVSYADAVRESPKTPALDDGLLSNKIKYPDIVIDSQKCRILHDDKLSNEKHNDEFHDLQKYPSLVDNNVPYIRKSQKVPSSIDNREPQKVPSLIDNRESQKVPSSIDNNVQFIRDSQKGEKVSYSDMVKCDSKSSDWRVTEDSSKSVIERTLDGEDKDMKLSGFYKDIYEPHSFTSDEGVLTGRISSTEELDTRTRRTLNDSEESSGILDGSDTEAYPRAQPPILRKSQSVPIKQPNLPGEPLPSPGESLASPRESLASPRESLPDIEDEDGDAFGPFSAKFIENTFEKGNRLQSVSTPTLRTQAGPRDVEGPKRDVRSVLISVEEDLLPKDERGTLTPDYGDVPSHRTSPFHKAKKYINKYMGGKKGGKKSQGDEEESEESQGEEEPRSPTSPKPPKEAWAEVYHKKKRRRGSKKRAKMTKEEKLLASQNTWNVERTSQWQYPNKTLVKGPAEIQQLTDFVYNKLVDLSRDTGHRDTKLDSVFKGALKTFHHHMISTVTQENSKVDLKYRDLMVNFEETLKVKASKEDMDDTNFPVTIGINSFRGLLDEFKSKKDNKELPEVKIKKEKKKKEKDKDILEYNGHRYMTVHFSMATFCELCNGLLLMDKALSCQTCKYTIHKKSCYIKSPVKCKGFKDDSKPHRKDKKIMAVPLADLVDSTQKVPEFFERLLTAIEFNGLFTEGIYRKPGAFAKVKQLIVEVDTDVSSVDFENYHIHVLTSFLTKFFRELPEPLLTFELYDDFIRATEISNDNERLLAIFSVIDKLPTVHYDVLERLIHHLSKVAQHESSNRMNSNSLAIIFSPGMLRTNRPLPAQESLKFIAKQTQCVQCIIEGKMRNMNHILADIAALESAQFTAEQRISAIRASKRANSCKNLVGDLELPSAVSEVSEEDTETEEDKEETLLKHQIETIRQEKEDLVANKLPLLECRLNSSEEDILATTEEHEQMDAPVAVEEYAVTFDQPVMSPPTNIRHLTKNRTSTPTRRRRPSRQTLRALSGTCSEDDDDDVPQQKPLQPPGLQQIGAEIIV